MATVALAWPRWHHRQRPVVRVNGSRLNGHLRELSRFGATPDGGINCVAYSAADLAGREYVIGLMEAAPLATSVDGAGNILGRRPGSDAGLAPLMFGSHTDSVPAGGNYDGQVGSLAAIEVAQTLAEHGIVTRHPLGVVIFQNEEGGKTGSRAISGEVAEREFNLVTRSGHTIGEGIGIIGGDSSRFRHGASRPRLHSRLSRAAHRAGWDSRERECRYRCRRGNRRHQTVDGCRRRYCKPRRHNANGGPA